MLADDAEARGVREEAAARHEDRIEAATAAAASLEGLGRALLTSRSFRAAVQRDLLLLPEQKVGGCPCRVAVTPSLRIAVVGICTSASERSSISLLLFAAFPKVCSKVLICKT